MNDGCVLNYAHRTELWLLRERWWLGVSIVLSVLQSLSQPKIHIYILYIPIYISLFLRYSLGPLLLYLPWVRPSLGPLSQMQGHGAPPQREPGVHIWLVTVRGTILTVPPSSVLFAQMQWPSCTRSMRVTSTSQRCTRNPSWS